MIERGFEGATARVALAVGSAPCRALRRAAARAGRGGDAGRLPGRVRHGPGCGQRPAEADVPDGAPGAAPASWGPGVVRHPDTASAPALPPWRDLARPPDPAARHLGSADGRLDPRARAVTVELGWPARDVDDRIVHAVEAAVLPPATELSIRSLKSLIRAQVADRRRKDAERLTRDQL